LVIPVVGPLGVVGVEIVSGIEKLAVTVLFPLIVRVIGLVVPVTLPLQLLKV
jgi:hypothetical protein